MTEPPIASDDPPFGPDTDEAVSAHLDGELAGFAAAHGLDEDTARQRLEAWPGFAARAGALERARMEMTPVAPLDEVTRRRLVQGAVREAAPSPGRSGARWGRALGWVAGAAAAVALVVGIGVVVTRDPGTEASQAGSDAGTDNQERAAAAAPEGSLGDLGDVTDPARLEALFGETDEAASGDATPRAPAASDRGADRSDVRENALRARPDTVDACAAQIAGGAPVRFTATGTFKGAPVVVVGISRDGRTIVFVVPPHDCTQVLSSVSR